MEAALGADWITASKFNFCSLQRQSSHRPLGFATDHTMLSIGAARAGAESSLDRNLLLQVQADAAEFETLSFSFGF